MKALMKYILPIVVIASMFYSCEETIQLDLKQTPPVVVIEGLVTNREGVQSVKVSMTTGFYNTNETPKVTDAVVVVTDDLGNEFPFVHNPENHDKKMGLYLPVDESFAGEIGRSYTLTVIVDGKTYTATDKLEPVIPIDSLKYRYDEDEAEDPRHFGKAYEVLVYAREPQDQTNYYQFRFYRNDSLKTYNDTDVYFSDDKYLGEKIDGIETPIYFAPGDEARVEFYSLTRTGYIFYYDLSSILNNDAGGMFGPVPASPRTNLSNGALGFFQVSAVNSASIVIE